MVTSTVARGVWCGRERVGTEKVGTERVGREPERGVAVGISTLNGTVGTAALPDGTPSVGALTLGSVRLGRPGLRVGTVMLGRVTLGASRLKVGVSVLKLGTPSVGRPTLGKARLGKLSVGGLGDANVTLVVSVLTTGPGPNGTALTVGVLPNPTPGKAALSALMIVPRRS